jgi:flagella basal body P-ring formation protein FlgA
LFALAVAAQGAPAALTATPKVLMLKVSATAHGPNVLVSDVLEGEVPPTLGRLTLKPAGRPGNKVKVDAALVALKLRREPKGPWLLQGPASCDVEVMGQKIPGETLKAFAADYIRAQLSGTAGVEIVPLGSVNDLLIYDPPARFKVLPPDHSGFRGNVVLRVQVLQEVFGGEEREAASVPVSFLVKRQEARLVATRLIRKGELFSGENLALVQQDATFDLDGIADLDLVAGKAATTYIPQGKPLSQKLVDFPPVIKRGDVVRLLVRSGGVVVEATAKALRDARLGESIPIELEGSKKQSQARCVEAGTVVRDAP